MIFEVLQHKFVFSKLPRSQFRAHGDANVFFQSKFNEKHNSGPRFCEKWLLQILKLNFLQKNVILNFSNLSRMLKCNWKFDVNNFLPVNNFGMLALYTFFNL